MTSVNVQAVRRYTFDRLPSPSRYGPWRVTAGNPCPICGRKSHCLADPDGRVAICSHAKGRSPLFTIAVGDVFALSSDFGDLAALPPYSPPPEIPEVPNTLEARQRVSEVLRFALDQLVPATPETDGLDGFTAEEIQAMGVRPAPGSDLDRRAFAASVLGRFGEARVRECPGLTMNRDGTLAIACLSRTFHPRRYLAFPVRDELGLIQALQARDLDAKGKDSKYFWVSKGNPRPRDPDGRGAPAAVMFHPVPTPGKPVKRFLLSEGTKKVCAGIFRYSEPGTVGISFQGVDAWKSAVNALDRLDPGRNAVVDIAADSDLATNPDVLKGISRLIHEVVTGGREGEVTGGRAVNLLSWNPVAKGFDDALFAGFTIFKEFHPRCPPGGVPPSGGRSQTYRTVSELARDLAVSGSSIKATLEEFIEAATKGKAYPLAVLAPPPGAGKTHQILVALAGLIRSGEWPHDSEGKPIRILFTEPTTAIVGEKAKALMGVPHVAIVGGRSAKNCFRHDEIKRLGQRGQCIAEHGCGHCREWWEQDEGGTPWAGCHGPDGAEGYTAQEARAKSPDSWLVLSTQAWAVANPKALEDYRGIVFDEPSLDGLRETLPVTCEDTAQWANEVQRIEKTEENPITQREAGRLKETLSDIRAEVAGASPEEALEEFKRVEWWDFPRPSLAEEVIRFRLMNPQGKHQRLAPLRFEEPLDTRHRIKPSVPLRGCRDVMDAIATRNARLEFHPDGRRVLLCDRDVPALKALAGKPVLLLDATPQPTILERVFGAEPRILGAGVDHVHLVQTHKGGAWTYAQVRKDPSCPGKALRIIGRELLQNNREPVAAFGYLELWIRCLVDRSLILPEILDLKEGRVDALAVALGGEPVDLPWTMGDALFPGAGVFLGWPEAHSRATNRLESFDVLVIFGPGEGLNLAAFEETARKWFRPGDLRGEDGFKDLSKRLMEEHIAATIRQQAGRLRGSRREIKPRVVLVTTHPILGLDPDEWTTLSELMGMPPPWKDASRFSANLRRSIVARQKTAGLISKHWDALADGVGKMGERGAVLTLGLPLRAARAVLHEWRKLTARNAKSPDSIGHFYNGPVRNKTTIHSGPLQNDPCKQRESDPFTPSIPSLVQASAPQVPDLFTDTAPGTGPESESPAIPPGPLDDTHIGSTVYDRHDYPETSLDPAHAASPQTGDLFASPSPALRPEPSIHIEGNPVQQITHAPTGTAPPTSSRCPNARAFLPPAPAPGGPPSTPSKPWKHSFRDPTAAPGWKAPREIHHDGGYLATALAESHPLTLCMGSPFPSPEPIEAQPTATARPTPPGVPLPSNRPRSAVTLATAPQRATARPRRTSGIAPKLSPYGQDHRPPSPPF